MGYLPTLFWITKKDTLERENKMAKFTVRATLTKDYEIEVEATDEMDAIKKLDDWIADDFEDFEVGARWDFEA
jgi:hypothetical protein